MRKLALAITIAVASATLLFPRQPHKEAPPWHQIAEAIDTKAEHLDLTPVSGGASNDNYRLVYAGKPYFVRAVPKTAALTGASLICEAEVLEALIPIAIAPQVIYLNEEHGILITEFIQPDSESDKVDEYAKLKQVAALLLKLHEADLPLTRSFNPFEAIDAMTTRLNESGGRLPIQYSDLVVPALNHIRELNVLSRELRPCHLDLHDGNILWRDARPWLIDWEHGAMADPLFDLATLASSEFWNDTQMFAFFSLYDTQHEPEELSRLFYLRIVADARWAVWCFLQAQISTIDFEYRALGDRHLKSILQRINSSLFSEPLPAQE